MKVRDKIYRAIIKNSDFIKEKANKWTRELASSKNYICTPDLKHWTFGKSVGDDGGYHYNGGVAKQHLYRLGFKNVLELKDKRAAAKVVKAFRTWAGRIEGYALLEKFDNDQETDKRFELLVHEDVLRALGISTLRKKMTTSQNVFDEGFRKQIIREVSVRDRTVVQQAKEKHGTVCAACDFDFAKVYGAHGEGFIEMHHLYPIALGKRKTTVEDLQPVCANCHRMLHKGTRLLSIEELKEIIEQAKR